MSIDYRDRWITCDDEQIAIRGYYFPWGTKHVPYARIRSVQRVKLGPRTGRGRIWGTSNPRLWASLDPGRRSKHDGLILELGAPVRPLLTPDDPQAMMDAIHAHTGPEALGPEGGSRRGRILPRLGHR